jgi:hypothetical protein
MNPLLRALPAGPSSLDHRADIFLTSTSATVGLMFTLGNCVSPKRASGFRGAAKGAF